MGKVKSGERKPPAKPKQRRKRQIDVEHVTGGPSGVDTRHALFTAISTRGCTLRFATYFQPVNNGESGWIVAGIFVSDSKLMFDSSLSDFSSSNFSAAEAVIFIQLAPISFDEDGFERKSDYLYQEPLSLSTS